MARLPNDCFANPADMISVDQARQMIADATAQVTKEEYIELAQAEGRILAADIYSEINVPPANNSAVDGYAFSFADYEKSQSKSFTNIGRSAAGTPFDGEIQAQQCVKIFTGAVMPIGCDSVAMVEDVVVTNNTARLPTGLRAGTNCRKAGEDIKAGSLLLAKGTRLRPQELAYLASIGTKKIPVSSKLKVALFSTGDELTDPGAPLQPGGIYDSNRFMLAALLRKYGCDVNDFGILEDKLETIRVSLTKAAEECDLILTSGGVSMGDEDHVKAAVEAGGSLHFWRIAIKPGRPLALGQVGNTAFVGLPGNPVAALVCALQFVRPLIARLTGESSYSSPATIVGAADFSLTKKIGRREWSRGRYRKSEKGEPIIEKYHSDGSGIVSSLIWANGLIELNEDMAEIKKGDPISFLPFSELFE